MSSKQLPRAFHALRTLFLAFMALAGLIMCLTVMHSVPAVHNVNAVPIAATAMAGHHEVQSVQGSGALGTAASCQGPCGQDHYMMAATCAIALLAPLLLMGAARITATWRPLTPRVQYFSERGGAVPPLMPPSLLFLSISRT